MDVAASTAFFATLVGLICNWKQERGAAAGDRKLDFLTWLESHNFNELKRQILESSEVQRELTQLLQQDSAQLADKLDLVLRVVAGISEKMEGFSALSRALGVSGSLSPQALDILKVFNRCRATGMIHLQQSRHLAFLPHGLYEGKLDARFLADDLATLEEVGLVRTVRFNGSGDPVYGLTRTGADYAAQFPPDDSVGG
jgi:hypothetical protein